MSRTLLPTVLAGLITVYGSAGYAQQTFGQADQTGGGLGGFGQMPMQQMPQMNGQFGAQGQPGMQMPQGQYGGAQMQQPQPGGQPGMQGQYGVQPQGQYGQGQYGGYAPQGQYGGSAPQGQYGGMQGQSGLPPQGQAGNQPGQPGMQPGMQPPQPGGQNPQLIQMLDQMAQFERQDFGVPAINQLHSGAMHGPTPASIPGGQIITTKGLYELIQGQQTPYMLFDVLGGGEILPGAIPAVQASSPGSFDDQVSQRMGQFLRQATQGNTQVPLIFYCASVECWMSYNAALRAIKLGYSNVLWYRGGIAAWKHAGGPTMQAGGGYGQQGG